MNRDLDLFILKPTASRFLPLFQLEGEANPWVSHAEPRHSVMHDLNIRLRASNQTLLLQLANAYLHIDTVWD